VDRFSGTGVLPLEVARDLGAVGVAARASGIAHDVRLDHPYAAYPLLTPPPLCVQPQGDVAARLRVRADEITASLTLLDEALTRLPHVGALARPLGALPVNESAFSVTESPRGANCHWLLTGPNNTLARYRIRSASFANWPVAPRAVQGNIVPDFPLINKSFELCYSCLDR
jgi:Ni,Fe-hydrogenase III large subunit